MTIGWPSNTTEIIDEIRDTIGRDITINVEVTGIPCPVSGCYLDPVTGLSTDQFCPTCSGFHWINTISGLTLTAHVRWGDADKNIWETGGYLIDGDCLVQIKYTTTNMDAVNDAKSFLVDDRVLVKKSVDLRGVPSVNRILVTLEQEE